MILQSRTELFRALATMKYCTVHPYFAPEFSGYCLMIAYSMGARTSNNNLVYTLRRAYFLILWQNMVF